MAAHGSAGPAYNGPVLRASLILAFGLAASPVLAAQRAPASNGHAAGASGGPTPASAARPPVDPATLAACNPPANCDTTIVPRSDPRRRRYDKWIVEAANEFGIEPGLLKAQVHTETSFAALSENRGEREKLMSDLGKTEAQAEAHLLENGGYGWGKGLGQFGASNAKSYGLDWWAPEPTLERLMSEDYNKPQASNGLYPVWSPKGALLAKAKMLRQRLDDLSEIDLQGPDGRVVSKNLAAIYPRNGAETARYTVAMYNRGRYRVFNSMKEYYRREGRLPDWFGEAWSVQPDESSLANPTLLRTPSSTEEAEPEPFRFLYGQVTARCHVFRIAGLCGDEAQNYLKEYRRDFRFNDGVWEQL